MKSSPEVFVGCVRKILERFFRQNGQPIPADSELAAIGQRLWLLIEERGLPRPLDPAERGEPGEMDDATVAPLLDRALGGVSSESRPAFVAPVKQLVKACFYPEFKSCRDSFREVSPDGSCRRQEPARARVRISGSHCVDCPHWVALTPAQHARYLAREWCSDPAGFAANREIFLPEDFRELRRFLYQEARRG